MDIMRKDEEKDPATDPNALWARMLINQVDRKLVKQTVITSVYGVTYISARDQIKCQLKEQNLIEDGEVFASACYTAKIIAMENEIVSWTTQLGLPVVQPCTSATPNQFEVNERIITMVTNPFEVSE